MSFPPRYIAPNKLTNSSANFSKKKKKSTASQRLREAESSSTKQSGEGAEAAEEGNEKGVGNSRSESPVVTSGKTGAQMRFEEVQRQRVSFPFTFHLIL